MSLPDLKNMTLAGLTDFVEEQGLAAFRARQLFSWLYRPGITSFSQMTDITKELRGRLDSLARISRLEPAAVERSRDGTSKFAFRLADGVVIESVLIPDADRRTLCVSSQAGCAMGCIFCLTGARGLVRNLEPAEIVGQVTAVNELLHGQEEGSITNLVFMGMGEPLANFDSLIDSLEILMEDRGFGFSERRITVSTCGLVPRIRELGKKTGVNLAVSLHSIRDSVRSRLMPINRTHGVSALLAACREYPQPRRKRIMFEYILLHDVNDSRRDAEQLAAGLRGIRCKINLLPYNKTDSLRFARPARERIDRFQRILREEGYTVLLRESRGADISAACGQLAGSYAGGKTA